MTKKVIIIAIFVVLVASSVVANANWSGYHRECFPENCFVITVENSTKWTFLERDGTPTPLTVDRQYIIKSGYYEMVVSKEYWDVYSGSKFDRLHIYAATQDVTVDMQVENAPLSPAIMNPIVDVFVLRKNSTFGLSISGGKLKMEQTSSGGTKWTFPPDLK